ncbi:ATP-binding protein [Aneurinibacillus sp. Ricciae_BoGa-3]|uniref:GAF domain-containing sensor histidine kinase n=1 Tax=Aneurinibacillus sp. Ricciae_BoGa-3 TaxID=3022697 RepID=UPI002340B859|nr:ATP-binding protein [Aneurinibacillus sp. Ricciae_BoGa-3]WCK55012.1 ATP-binding protein [Aneurinibacillus sp. Ricciae_BoGa-3]
MWTWIKGKKALRWFSRGFIVWSASFFIVISVLLSYQLFRTSELALFSFFTCIGVVMTTYSPFYFGILVQVYKYSYRHGSAVYMNLAAWSRSAAISITIALSGIFVTTTLFVYIIAKTIGNAITLTDVLNRAVTVSFIIGVPVILLIMTIRRFYFQQLKQKQIQLRSLQEVSEKLYKNLDLEDDFLKDVVVTVRDVIGAKYAALALFTEERKIARFIYAGWDGMPGMSLPEGRGLLGHLANVKHPVRTSSVARHPKAAGAPDGHPLMESFLGVPILYEGNVIGSFYLTNKVGAVQFTKEDEEMVELFSRSLGIAIKNSQYVQELIGEHKAAQEAARLKSQILSTTSHELRTPLHAIIGYSEILIDSLKDTLTNKQMANLERIKESGSHLQALINDILSFSKMDSGSIPLEKRRFSLHSVIQFCIHNTSGLLRGKPVTFTVTGEEHLFLYSDEQKIKQVMMNLLSNAVKFTEEGCITIDVSSDKGLLQITVQDTGIGIPEEKIDEIFQPFKQLDGSLSRKYSGTGLGLAITKGLTDVLGGSLTVKSNPGKGSCFTVKIPVEIESPVEKGDRGYVMAVHAMEGE